MTEVPISTVGSRPPRNHWWDVWDQFKVHKGALIWAFFFLLIVFLVLFGPVLWDIDPSKTNIRSRNQVMSWTHPFGTDQLGRDIFARMIAGGRVLSLIHI